ncbi:MAG: hypothetical protein IKR76_10180, partial [Ruminococcus sp.]|nr:hypothetical protein [Ruminococcus sp.]
MRKKLISLLTALIVFTGYSLPAFAEEITADGMHEAEQIIAETSEDCENEETFSTDDAGITDDTESTDETADETAEEEISAEISDETEDTETSDDTENTDEDSDDD